jgi:hypothetical protein
MAVPNDPGGNPHYPITIRGRMSDTHDPATGKAKRLVIYFPIPGGIAPAGAIADPATVKNGKATQAAFEMFINPRQFSIRYPTRSQIIQTIGGAYVDSFGWGLPSGQLSGTFGWGTDALGHTGLERAATLKALYYGWQNLTVSDTALCHLMMAGNGTSKETDINMLIFPGELTYSRSESSPLMIDFTLPFTVMKDYNKVGGIVFYPPVGTIFIDGGAPPVSGEGDDDPDTGNKKL